VTCSAKLAILAMYLSILLSKKLILAVYIIMGFTVAFLIAFLLIFLIVCLSVSAQWSKDVAFTLSHCRAIQSEEFASVGANMALDLIIVAIPIPSVWGLKMTLSKKIFVTSIFSMGLA
jgi:hypothetical protein